MITYTGIGLLENRGHQSTHRFYIVPVPVFRTRPPHASVVMSVSHSTATRIRPGTSGYSITNHIVPKGTRVLGPKERTPENTYFVRG
jgi:hypothetical protein